MHTAQLPVVVRLRSFSSGATFSAQLDGVPKKMALKFFKMARWRNG